MLHPEGHNWSKSLSAAYKPAQKGAPFWAMRSLDSTLYRSILQGTYTFQMALNSLRAKKEGFENILAALQPSRLSSYSTFSLAARLYISTHAHELAIAPTFASDGYQVPC
jgi:hypothetical protein